MRDDECQIFPCWNRNLQKSKGKKLECILVIIDQRWKHQCELIFSLLQTQMLTQKNIICIHTGYYTHIYLLALLAQGLKEMTPQQQKVLLATRSLFLISFSNNRNHRSLKKWPILELGQEICNRSPENLIVPESKEGYSKKSSDGVFQRDIGVNF